MASRHPRAPDETFGYSTQDGVAGTAVAGETLQLGKAAKGAAAQEERYDYDRHGQLLDTFAAPAG